MCTADAPTEAPQGYCPRCDYPARGATCPECGLDLHDRRLRRRPRGWLARHRGRLAIAAAAVVVCAWLGLRDVDIFQHLPTSVLLTLQPGDGLAARGSRRELGRRHNATVLNPRQTERFIRRWFHITWEPHTPWWREGDRRGGRYLSPRLDNVGYPTGMTLNNVHYEVYLDGVELDGKPLPTRPVHKWWQLFNYLRPYMRPVAARTARHQFWGQYNVFAPTMRMYNMPWDDHTLEIIWHVEAEDLVQGTRLAAWSGRSTLDVRVSTRSSMTVLQATHVID